MILVAFRDDAAQNGAPKIIFSRISPPIYVDSRIAAREKKSHFFVPTAVAKDSADGSLNSELFDPHLLMKDYFKKVKGKGKKEEETKIENDLKGIFDYLTAPNIRKKTKSILFFLLRFSKCIKIYLPVDPFQSLPVDSSEEEKRHPRRHLPSCHRKARSAALSLPLRRADHPGLRVHQSGVPRDQAAHQRTDHYHARHRQHPQRVLPGRARRELLHDLQRAVHLEPLDRAGSEERPRRGL